MRMSVKPQRLLLASTSVLAIQTVLLGPLAAQTYSYSDGQNATAPIILNPPGATLDVATGSATQSGVISDTAASAITKTGAGTLTLTGANTYTGGTTLSAGTLVLGNVDALGGGMIAPASGTELRIATNGAFVDALRLLIGIDATVSVTHATNVSWTGYTLYSNSTLHIGSAGNDGTITLYATAPNGFASNTTLSVDYGTFRPGDALTAGTSTPGQYIGTLNVGAAGTYDLNGFNAVAGNLTGVGRLVNNGTGDAVFTMTGGTSTFGGSIQDGTAKAGLAIDGGATLTLTGANTYTGGTTITSGTLQIGNGGTTGSIAGDVVDNGTLAFNRSDAVTFAGTISGSGVVSQAGSGTLTLTGANTYSGGTTIDAGTLVAGSASALGVGTVTLATGTELVLGASATYLNPLRLLPGLEAALSAAHGIDATLIGYFLYPGSTLHVGSAGNDGTVTMEALGGSGFGTNATISVDYGTFRPGDARTAGSSGLANGTIDTINVGAAGTYDLNGFQAMATNLTGAGHITNNGASAAAFTMNGGTGSFSGVIQDGTATTALTIDGNGSLTLIGNNSYTGGTTIASGTLQVGNGGTTGSIVGDVVDNGALVFDRSDAVSLNGAISGSGTVSQIGSGTLTLSGINSYTGGTGLLGGVLSVSSEANLGATAGALTFNGGILQVTGTSFIASTRTINWGAAGGGFDIADPANAFTVSQALSGSGSLTKLGAGTLVLTGTNSYTGGTTIGAGTLQLGNGGTSGSIAGNVVNNGTLAFDRSDAVSFADVISGSGAVRQIGAGALTLSGVNTYTGATTIDAGTILALSGTGSIAASSGVEDNGSFDISGTTAGASIRSLSGAGSVSLGGKALTITNAAGTFAGAIGDGGSGGSLTLSGGSLILTGTNNYTGGTTIAGGTLQIGNGGTTGSIAGDIVDDAALAFNRSDAVTFGGTISGSGAVSQIGSGTLALTGNNSYGGGTLLLGGVLSVSSDANLGATPGALAFDGGVLQITGTGFTSTTRAITLGAGGGGFDIASAANVFTLNQEISGSGALTKSGGGTLVLNGTNSYTGGTVITAGTLQIGNGGTSGSVTGNIIDNAALAFNRSDATTFAGTISGSGSLAQIGTGTTILTGTNTYAGGTVISSGVLQIGNGGTSGSVAGNIVDNAALVFNLANDLTFAGAISGAGVLRQAGAGKTELTGDSSAFAGTTYVDAGTLAVNGTLGGNVDVSAGGRLQGIGTVGTTLVSGTLAPGNSIGTLNVAGGIIFNAGSVFEVEVNAAGQSDRVNATGFATLNGGSVQVVAGTGNYAPSTRYTILTAAGVSGTFAGVTSNLAFLDPSLSSDAANVYLTLTRNNTDFSSVGTTPTQVATGGGVESLGYGNAVYDAVLNLARLQAQAAFDQLSGEIHASTRTALIEDSRFLRNAVTDRIRSAFDSVGAARDPVVTYVDGKPRTAAAITGGVALWGQSFGAWGHNDSDGNAARLARSSAGFIAGVDTTAFDIWRIGAVAGYSRTSFNATDRNSSGSSDNYHTGLYGGTQWGRLALRTGVAGTWSNVAVSRWVSFTGLTDSLKAGYDASTLQAFGEFGYGLRAGLFGFEPFANLAYVRLRTGGFTEQGGPASLTAATATSDITFTTLGLRTSASLAAAGIDATAKTTFGWRHAFGDTTPAAALRFASGGDAFSVAGVPVGRDAAIVEAGFDLALTRASALNVAYGAQLGNGFSDQSLKAGFNVKF